MYNEQHQKYQLAKKSAKLLETQLLVENPNTMKYFLI